MAHKATWYRDWFNSPYYHLLYRNRNFAEAEKFVDNLFEYLQLPAHAHVIDLGCGKGRHSVYIHEKGYIVTGLDLSPNNIREASEWAKPGLNFQIHDMREPFYGPKAQLVVNLFTSFGYFDDDEQHARVLQSVHRMLEYKGVFVLDFLNADKVVSNLPVQEELQREQVQFKIRKHLSDGFIVKDILFSDMDKDYHFQERVKALTEKSLTNMLEKAGFTIRRRFGNYELSPFKADQSDRLIFIAQKNA